MNKFKKSAALLAVLFVLSFFCQPAARALDYPDVGANAIVLLDMNDNQVLYSRNADAQVYPASLTKIMTVLIAAEAIETGRVGLYDTVTAQEDSSFDTVADGSTANIQPGEIMTLQDLLYCALLASANEACNIIAEYLDGSVQDFVAEMNSRAAELGCTHTHFVNTHGLPDENHYTTAGDMSLIAREAAESSLFMEICNTVSFTVPATNLSEMRELSNTNALLNPDSMYSDKYYYEYAKGMKTGYTSDAGHCLISTASKNGVSLLAVVMGADATGEGDATVYGNFADSITLYNWVFKNFSYREILKTTDQIAELPVSMGSTDSVVLRPGSSIVALLPNDEDLKSFSIETSVYSEQEDSSLQAPIPAGEVLGEVTVSRNGVVYGTSTLVAGAAVELSRVQYMKSQLETTLHSTVVRVVFWTLILLVVIYILLVIRYRLRYARHKRQVRQARQAAAERKAGSGAAPKQPAEPSVARAAGRKGSAPPPGDSEARKSADDRDYFEEFFGRKK
jgi:D-alanyl-D-alanine carboxypeptidase (penicillin-binding protein 5/6)